MNKLCVRQYCPFFCRITIFHQVESMFLLTLMRFVHYLMMDVKEKEITKMNEFEISIEKCRTCSKWHQFFFPNGYMEGYCENLK